MKQPTLAELCNEKDVARELERALYEQLGMLRENGERLSRVDKKLGFDRPHHYELTWIDSPGNLPLGTFLKILRTEVSEGIYQRGLELCKQRFKKFDPRKTKLTSDMIETLWEYVSSFFRKKIYETHDEKNVCTFYDKKEPFLDLTIPGLEFAVEGPIKFDNEEGDFVAIRRILKEGLKETDDVESFYRKARNNLFEFWRNYWGLFNGG